MAGIRVLLVLLLSVSPLFACFPSPNLILCWDTQEGLGTTTKDSSGNGTTGTLAGSSAWVSGPKPRGMVYSTNVTSSSFVNTGDWMVSLPGIAGSDVRSVSSTKYAFTGASPFIVGVTFQVNALRSGNDRELIGCATSGVGGWEFYYDATDDFGIRIITVEAPNFGFRIPDLNPHRAVLGRNSLKKPYLGFDGKFIGTMGTGDSNVIATTDILALGGNGGGLGVFAGKASRVAVYDMDFTVDEFKKFVKDDYLYWQGIDDVSDER